MKSPKYTTQLQAGLGLIEETKNLLDMWQPDMDRAALLQTVLEAGSFPNMTARRLRNLVTECFAPRYLSQEPPAAWFLKQIQPVLNSREFEQLLFLYTCRANLILADFIREIFWPAYAAGRNEMSNKDSRIFVEQAVSNVKTTKPWSEGTIRRVSAYLTGACADFGLLEPGRKSTRQILSFRLEQRVAIILAYELHFTGLGDNSIVSHLDWSLFGLEPMDVIDQLKRLALNDWLIVQAAGNVVRISWHYQSMEELIDALT